MSAVVGGFLAEVVEQDSSSAYPRLGIFLHTFQFLHVHLFLSAFLRKGTQLDDVCHRVEQYRVGRSPIPSGSAYLLIETLNALGEVVVNDPSHISLVYTHAEGYGGAYHLHLVHLESFLHRSPFLCAQTCMISRGIDTFLL